MKRFVLAAVAVVLIGLAFFAWRFFSAPREVVRITATPAPTTPPPAPPARVLPSFPSAATAPVTPAFTPRPDPRKTGSPLAAELNAPTGSPERDVQVLHEMLRQYLRLLHHRQGLPIGNDTDLLRALTGHNPMKLTILPPTHPAVGADGRLRDRWGTPYAIHPRGNAAYEIRSAGPDRKLFTADDLIANPPLAPVMPHEEADAPGDGSR